MFGNKLNLPLPETNFTTWKSLRTRRQRIAFLWRQLVDRGLTLTDFVNIMAARCGCDLAAAQMVATMTTLADLESLLDSWEIKLPTPVPQQSHPLVGKVEINPSLLAMLSASLRGISADMKRPSEEQAAAENVASRSASHRYGVALVKVVRQQ